MLSVEAAVVGAGCFFSHTDSNKKLDDFPRAVLAGMFTQLIFRLFWVFYNPYQSMLIWLKSGTANTG